MGEDESVQGAFHLRDSQSRLSQRISTKHLRRRMIRTVLPPSLSLITLLRFFQHFRSSRNRRRQRVELLLRGFGVAVVNRLGDAGDDNRGISRELSRRVNGVAEPRTLR